MHRTYVLSGSNRQLWPLRKGTVIIRVVALLTVTFIPSVAIGEGAIAENNLAAVNETISREVDVIGDGTRELILLNLLGESWEKPFKWTLTIKAKGRVIFEYQSDDTWLDAFFAEEGYIQGCADYLSCKKKYYEEDILKWLVIVTDLSHNKHTFERSNPGSIHVVARTELVEKYRLSESRASQIVESMISRLRSGQPPVLYVLISAVQSNFPIMYVPEVNGFVKVYEW